MILLFGGAAAALVARKRFAKNKGDGRIDG